MSKVNFEKYLQLEQDLRRYRKAIREAREIIMDQEITHYPIFILHQQQLDMGIPIIEAENNAGLWTVHASSIEEFVIKSILLDSKIEEFKKVYNSHDHHFCIFVISELGAQFIFFPDQDEIYKEYGSLN